MSLWRQLGLTVKDFIKKVTFQISLTPDPIRNPIIMPLRPLPKWSEPPHYCSFAPAQRWITPGVGEIKEAITSELRSWKIRLNRDGIDRNPWLMERKLDTPPLLPRWNTSGDFSLHKTVTEERSYCRWWIFDLESLAVLNSGAEKGMLWCRIAGSSSVNSGNWYFNLITIY